MSKKFRVWDTRQNKYLHPDTVSISGSGIMSFAGTGGKYHTITQPSDDPSPRFIIEPYTGLKDKNDVEIAVGDILMDNTGEPIEYWVVKFSDGGFVGESISVIENIFELTGLEIVGNIHQNPELLEEEK